MALSLSNLKTVRKFLFSVREKWYDIGVELDIDPVILDRIRDTISDPKDCLTEMIKEWLKSNPTLRALETALKEEMVDEMELAEKVTSLSLLQKEDKETASPVASGKSTDGGTYDNQAEVADSDAKPDLEPTVREFSIKLEGDDHRVRDYQRELAEPGVQGKNYIMIAPTGSGKTLSVALVIADHLKKNQLQSPCHVAFVTETKPLAKQQKEKLKMYIPDAKVEVFTSDNAAQKVAESIKNRDDISVCTATKLLNEIQTGKVTFKQLSLIVFDECHHATKGHPFSKLIDMYLEFREGSDRMPQIIGLTASPGAGDNPGLDTKKSIDHLVHLAARLDATSGFKTVTKNLEELKKCTKVASYEQLFENRKSISSDPFYCEVAKEMDRLEDEVSKVSVKNDHEKWSQEYETKIQEAKGVLERSSDTSTRDDITTLDLLFYYSQALNMYRDLQQTDAVRVMENFKFPASCMPRELRLKDGMQSLLKSTAKIRPSENPLLQSLERILINQFKQENSQGIIFVRTKLHAKGMSEWLENHTALEMVKPDVLIGQTETGWTQFKQDEVTKRFREGKTNLLIATSVGNEGLDIPACDFIVRYQHVTNEIQRVQTQGRARAENSHGYLLCSDRKRTIQDFKNAELIELAEEILQNKWFPTNEILLEQLVEIQRSIVAGIKLKRRMKKDRQQQQKSQEYRLLCKKCKEFACFGSDVFTVPNGAHTGFIYVVPCDEFSEKFIVKPHPESEPRDQVYGEIETKGKIHCSNCDQDWGVKCFWTKDGHNFPVVKCKGFMFMKQEAHLTMKKWKDAPFKMEPLSKFFGEDGNDSESESSCNEN